jgi:hypothetical protein
MQSKRQPARTASDYRLVSFDTVESTLSKRHATFKDFDFARNEPKFKSPAQEARLRRVCLSTRSPGGSVDDKFRFTQHCRRRGPIVTLYPRMVPTLSTLSSGPGLAHRAILSILRINANPPAICEHRGRLEAARPKSHSTKSIALRKFMQTLKPNTGALDV